VIGPVWYYTGYIPPHANLPNLERITKYNNLTCQLYDIGPPWPLVKGSIQQLPCSVLEVEEVPKSQLSATIFKIPKLYKFPVTSNVSTHA